MSSQPLRSLREFEDVIGGFINAPCCDDKVCSRKNGSELRDQYPASFRIVEDANIAVAGAFRRDAGDEKFRHAVEISYPVAHVSPQFLCIAQKQSARVLGSKQREVLNTVLVRASHYRKHNFSPVYDSLFTGGNA